MKIHFKMATMKNRLLFLLTIMGISNLSAQNNFIGDWQNADKTIVMQIYKQDFEYFGKVIASDSDEQIIVLIQMKRKSKRRMFGGTYYNPELKSENEARLKLIDQNTIRMNVLSGLFNDTILWHRVKLDYEEKTNQLIVLQY